MSVVKGQFIKMNNYIKKCFSKANIFLSIFIGVSSYLCWTLFYPQDRFSAIIFGSLFALGLMIALPFVFYFDERKYKDINESIEGEIIAKEKVNLDFSGKVRNGYFILTADSVYLFSRDKTPYIQEKIPKELIKDIRVRNYSNLYLIVSEEISYTIISGKCENIIQLMQKNGWM